MRRYLLAVIAGGMLCLGHRDGDGITRWDKFSRLTTAISARDLGHCGRRSSRSRRTLVHLNNSVVLTHVLSPGEISDIKVKAAKQGSRGGRRLLIRIKNHGDNLEKSPPHVSGSLLPKALSSPWVSKQVSGRGICG